MFRKERALAVAPHGSEADELGCDKKRSMCKIEAVNDLVCARNDILVNI